MCELYCPVDALYVAPEADCSVEVEENQLSSTGVLGSYRSVIGWNPRRPLSDAKDKSYKMFEAMAQSEGIPMSPPTK